MTIKNEYLLPVYDPALRVEHAIYNQKIISAEIPTSIVKWLNDNVPYEQRSYLLLGLFYQPGLSSWVGPEFALRLVIEETKRRVAKDKQWRKGFKVSFDNQLNAHMHPGKVKKSDLVSLDSIWQRLDREN